MIGKLTSVKPCDTNSAGSISEEFILIELRLRAQRE